MRKKIVLDQDCSVLLSEAFEKFLNEKRAVGRAEDTLLYYENRWNYFKSFLDTKEITRTDEITSDLVLEYITYTRQRNPEISDITINNYLRGIRAVLYYFMEKEYTRNFSIKMLNAKNTIKVPFTLEEQKLLVKKPNMKTCSFSEYRNWVIVCHLLATGNRSRTVRCIRNKDVNLPERTIRLDSVKNNLVYDIPITDDYYKILKEYMEVRKGNPDDYLFCTQYGKQITADGFRTILGRYMSSRGVDKSSIHLFRNTFAKAWILADGSSKKLQRALGHKTSKMVDVYVQLYGKELEEDFSKCTPLSMLKYDVEKKKIRK